MFVKDRVSDLAIFEHGARNFMAQLPPSGQTVELMDLLYRATLDITVEFLLGGELNSLQKYEAPLFTGFIHLSCYGRGLIPCSPQSSFAEAFSELQRIQIRIATLA